MFFAYILVSGEGHGLSVSAFTLKRIKNKNKTPIWIDTNQMKRPSESTAMPFQLNEIRVLEKLGPITHHFINICGDFPRSAKTFLLTYQK